MKYITFFGSARIDANCLATLKSRELAHALALRGCGIITGGGAGIMQAANEGAQLAKAPSIGINIILPHEQKSNPFCSETKLHTNLSARRAELISRADGFVVCAGGLGTLDELFEVLTLSQTKLSIKPVVLFGVEFWRELDEFLKKLANSGLADKSPLYLLSDDFEEIFKYLGV